jgi:hypothetical protein
MVGAELYVQGSDGSWTHETISAIDSGNDTITVDSSILGMAEGSVFAVSPVVMELRLWPVGAMDPESAAFERRKISGMGVHACVYDFTGCTDDALGTLSNTPNAQFQVGVYRNNGTTDAAFEEIDMDVDPPDCFAYFTADGVLVEPFVRVVCSGADFQLTDVEVDVTMSTSRQTG